jgi:hypothetical protein
VVGVAVGGLELLDERERPRACAFMTVAEVAAVYRVSPQWVYAHQRELGAVRLGDGPKARLRFDPTVIAQRRPVEAASEPATRSSGPAVRPRRRRLVSRPAPPFG